MFPRYESWIMSNEIRDYYWLGVTGTAMLPHLAK